MSKPQSVFLLPDDFFRVIYHDKAISRIREMTSNDGLVHTRKAILQQPDNYQDVEIIFSG
ncbi:hypothetical protein [Coraliomargarita parva]|uniref:hypothetical protein n=1 Tax=Coraliomargarita parva TaxID=3014050 RepID=UPI0022B32100|nr:hypothetical protein [Coraliomargarita parva]